MGDPDPNFPHALKQQSWSLYSVGMFTIVLRLFARTKRLGIRQLQPDDYLMLLVAALYTTLVVCLNVIAQGGGSNLYEPQYEGTFSPVEVEERIYGSKIVVVSEQAMLNVIYAVKCCMLVMYTRLTLGLATQRLVRHLAVYVGVGWAASQVAFFANCRPFREYWAVPARDAQCATFQRYSIVQACFNISSDVLMLFVPLPLVMKTSMPLKQKAVLSFIFSMGLFVIVAALLTKIYNLSDVWDPHYMLWYVREASVAVYVSNLPMIWPLLREWLPFLSGLTPGGSSSRGKKGLGASSGGNGYVKYGSRSGTADARGGTTETRITGRRPRADSLGSLGSDYDLAVVMDGGKGKGGKYKADDTESTEQIVMTEDIEVDVRDGSHDSIGVAITKMGGIQVRRTVEVLEERDGKVMGEEGKPANYSVDVEVEKRGYNWERARREHGLDVETGGI